MLMKSENIMESENMFISSIDIKEIICMREHDLREYIAGFLFERQIPYNMTENYIVTTMFKSDKTRYVPLICTHTDVASSNPLTPDFIFENDGILSTAPPYGCLGADDRAGVWIALMMIDNGTATDFEYGFFVAEERGAIGSTAFAAENDLSRFSCFIGLDRACRQGQQQVALYDYDNDELTAIFTDLGYEEAWGTFTDCSSLSGDTLIDKRACVNLSVGYQFEHTAREILDLYAMEETLDNMLEVVIPEKIYEFVYAPRVYGGRSWGYGTYYRGYNSRSQLAGDWEHYEEWESYAEADTIPDGTEIVCEFCDQHEKLYEYQGSQVCAACLELVRK